MREVKARWVVLAFVLGLSQGFVKAEEPVAFKGVALGADMVTVQQAFADFTCSAARQECVYAGAGRMTYAGFNPTSVRARFVEGQLAEVRVLVNAAAHGAIVESFTERHGTPIEQTRSVVKSGAGVEHVDVYTLWSLAAGARIEVHRLYGDVRTTMVLLQNKAGAEMRKALDDEQRAKAKKDV